MSAFIGPALYGPELPPTDDALIARLGSLKRICEYWRQSALILQAQVDEVRRGRDLLREELSDLHCGRASWRTLWRLINIKLGCG